MPEDNKNKISLLLVLVLIIGAIGFYLYWSQTPGKKEVYKTSFDEGVTLQAKGDDRARYKFEEALRSAASLEEEAVAKLNIGTAYFSSDPPKAVQILKEVYANTSYPPRTRAAAIDLMVQWYSSSFDIDLFQNHVFTGGKPWESFLEKKETKPTKRDIEIAIRKAEEHATTIHSLFTSEYAIAFLYSRYGLLENLDDKKKVDEYTAVILDRIARGDNDLNMKITTGANVRVSQYGWGLFYKAFALTNLHSAGVYKDTDAIEKAYSMAIAYQEQVPRIELAINERLNYMIFLSRLNDPAADEKIKEQVSLLFAKGLETNQKYKDSLATLIKNPRYNKNLGKIANLNSQFKNLIISLGWREK